MSIYGSPAWYGVLVVLGVLVVALLSKWSGGSATRFPPKFTRDVKSLVTEAARWSAVAEQDTNAMLRVLHATYAVAYLNAARTFADDKDLERISGVRVPELQAQMQTQQQDAIQKVGVKCPSVVPEGAQALYTGWLG